MDCNKILDLFRSELVTVNVGPRLFATALEKQGDVYKRQVPLPVFTRGHSHNGAERFPEHRAGGKTDGFPDVPVSYTHLHPGRGVK